VACLKRAACNKVGTSLRKLARRFDSNRMTVSRSLKREGVQYYKRERAPKYTDKQLEEIPSMCRRLLRDRIPAGISIIIDDEKYFSFNNNESPGNAGYYTTDRKSTPSAVRYKKKKKFNSKMLVWIAMSE